MNDCGAVLFVPCKGEVLMKVVDEQEGFMLQNKCYYYISTLTFQF